jgi:hypothetical protein
MRIRRYNEAQEGLLVKFKELIDTTDWADEFKKLDYTEAKNDPKITMSLYELAAHAGRTDVIGLLESEIRLNDDEYKELIYDLTQQYRFGKYPNLQKQDYEKRFEVIKYLVMRCRGWARFREDI